MHINTSTIEKLSTLYNARIIKKKARELENRRNLCTVFVLCWWRHLASFSIITNFCSHMFNKAHTKWIYLIKNTFTAWLCHHSQYNYFWELDVRRVTIQTLDVHCTVHDSFYAIVYPGPVLIPQYNVSMEDIYKIYFYNSMESYRCKQF